MQYDFLYTDLKAYIHVFRDLYIEEFQKTGGTPPSSVIYRITAVGDDRIDADGNRRITADSAYP